MFVTVLLAATLAAPVPKDKPAEVYFPTTEATKWLNHLSFDGKGVPQFGEPERLVIGKTTVCDPREITVERVSGRWLRHPIPAAELEVLKLSRMASSSGGRV